LVIESVAFRVTRRGLKGLEGSRDAAVLAEQMLSGAYELVLGGWCQGVSAQDELGRAIEPSSVFARRWSAPGAVERVWRRIAFGSEGALIAFERANLALTAAVHDVPQRWNDALDRTKQQVLEALLEASGLVSALQEASLELDLLDDLESYRAIPEFHLGRPSRPSSIA
jgi:hypothetical protein